MEHKAVKGFFVCLGDRYGFRVYDESLKYIDYEIQVEDLEFFIESDHLLFDKKQLVYFLWLGDRYVFRVYDESLKYTDYEIQVEDLENLEVSIKLDYYTFLSDKKQLVYRHLKNKDSQSVEKPNESLGG